MIRLLFLSIIYIVACTPSQPSDGPKVPTPPTNKIPWPAGLPVYDHIVIVVEENKNYDAIISDTTDCPYINYLANTEANFLQMFANEHHSQGNYFWLFSGDNQNVGFGDTIPTQTNNSNYPFTTANLGQQLIDKGLSFKGYAESLPQIGSMVPSASPYARKHVPWISFKNVPNGNTVATSSNLRFLDFPDSTHYDQLPTVSFVIPDLQNDMHDGTPNMGDNWLQDKLGPYLRWAKGHNSLLIVTFDENGGHTAGLTNPFADSTHIDFIGYQNRIVTIFAGAHIKRGQYMEGKGVTHVNILRTIESMYGLAKAGAQQKFAAAGGITDDYIITDVFEVQK
ncbi:MAG: alkaline phosphatase family protein [Saprospiraceae bacterium]